MPTMSSVKSYDQLYIGGHWVDPSTSDTIDVVSPATESVIAHTPAAGAADIDRAVAAARQAFDHSPWPHLDPSERAAVLTRLLEAYWTRSEEMGHLVTAEMGSPRWFADMAQGGGAGFMLHTLLEVAKTFPFEARGEGMGANTVIRREPVGVVGAITPWNVPQLVIMPKLAPALLAGCCIVVKAAPETPLDALLLAELIDEAGFPEGVVSIVPGGREAGEHLVRHPGVDKISFTGSGTVGRRIAAICGERLARCSLELGGKSAAILLEDADIERTVEGLKFTSLLNNGQACVAQTRISAPRLHYDEVVDALAQMVSDLPVGDPTDPETYIGPLVSARQRERVSGYIASGPIEGAETVVGGPGAPDGAERGWFVRPTVFSNVDNSMRIAQEEIFGPVLCVIPFDSEDDAVRIANDSSYGLAGSIWTKETAHGQEVANRLRTGMVGINGFSPDLSSPFGGYKESGIGREYGATGLSEYLEYKSIYGAP